MSFLLPPKGSMLGKSHCVNHVLSYQCGSPREEVTILSSLSLRLSWRLMHRSMIQRRKTFQSCKFIPLAFTFSITHLGIRYFQQIPSTQSKSYLWGALCARGEWPGHRGEGCKRVFSPLPPQTLLLLVH